MVHFKYTSYKTFVFLVAMSTLLVGCFPFTQKSLKLHVINVLDKELYKDCHITGSINIPFEDFDEDFEDIIEKYSKDDHYVIYCTNYSCTSSMYVARMLKEHGYKYVWEYGGGMADWYQKNLPVTGPAKQEYLKADNKPLDTHTGDIPDITAEELHTKMKKFGLV